jgi:hypothetical protein
MVVSMANRLGYGFGSDAHPVVGPVADVVVDLIF